MAALRVLRPVIGWTHHHLFVESVAASVFIVILLYVISWWDHGCRVVSRGQTLFRAGCYRLQYKPTPALRAGAYNSSDNALRVRGSGHARLDVGRGSSALSIQMYGGAIWTNSIDRLELSLVHITSYLNFTNILLLQ